MGPRPETRHAPTDWAARSGAIRLDDIDWDGVGSRPLSPALLRTLRYMQDIEAHTIVYLRTLLGTRTIDDPDVATFLACWFHQETFHGLAFARFLEAAGHPVTPRARSIAPLADRLRSAITAAVGRRLESFAAVHMTWGAINELTTLLGYRALIRHDEHPILTEILRRIARDEAGHFAFYLSQAAHRLADGRSAHLTRRLVDTFWAPVGSGVQPEAETRFVVQHCFGDPEGRRAAEHLDETIGRLPGFSGVRLVTAWL